MKCVRTTLFALIVVWSASILAPAALFAVGLPLEKLPGVVVDDAAAELQGNWAHSTRVSPFVNEGYRYAGPADGVRAVFRVPVATAGSYHVLVAFTPSANRSTRVPYSIATTKGVVLVEVNQTHKPKFQRIFESLGEFELSAGEVEVAIDVAAAAEGVVIVDAVQLLSPAEFAELKRHQPASTPQLAVAAPVEKKASGAQKKATSTTASEPPLVAAPFVRQPPTQPRKRLTSAELDTLLDEVTGAVSNAPLCDDTAFLRRVTLDLIGRQPTPAEIAAFTRATQPDKRQLKVEQLLASSEFGVNWANYWSDVISYRTPQPELTFLNYGPFKTWLAGEINAGRKWDEIVYQVITAGGKVGENPAATFIGFHQADRSRLASETTRVFLSTQIQCAECHDHKFIDLPQETFHHVAAYFARVEAKLPWNDSHLIEVKSREKGEHKMPGGKDEMTPAAFGSGSSELGASDLARRTDLARWLTQGDNPWFAKAFVNRAWGRLMGRGFSEPVDEIGELGDHVLPELFTAVADHFIATEYDIKELFRVVALSRAYQRPLAEMPKGYVKPFAVVSPGRLRGDEVFDSLVQAVELPNITPPAVKPSEAVRFPPPPKSTRDLVNEAFGNDPSLAAEQVNRSMQQVMFMMNNRQLQQQIDGRPESDTILAKLLVATSDDRELAEQLYQRVLARNPTEQELAIALEHVATVGERRAAWEDILWSLLNSAEFVSRR